MSRRVRVPGADELFRSTGVPEQGTPASEAEGPTGTTEPSGPTGTTGTPETAAVVEQGGPSGPRTHSGRVRHDEKMTVYVTAEELLDLEHARLTLRRAGVSVDRGRLVRAAMAIALADLEDRGDDSEIVRRLRQT